jgi:hypothetical protein
MAREHWLEPPEWWKKWKPLRWAAIGGIIFVVVSGTWTAKVIIEATSRHEEAARFTAGVADPAVLLDGIRSYDPVASVLERLDQSKLAYRVSQSRPPPSAKYPPRDRDTVVVDRYVHLGVEGQLTLEFFNDRLFQATFIPVDPDTYAGKLHAADRRLKRDRSGRIQVISGHLRIATNVDFAITEVGRSLQTRPYVIWEDRRLVELLDEWDRRFVALPSPRS